MEFKIEPRLGLEVFVNQASLIAVKNSDHNGHGDVAVIHPEQLRMAIAFLTRIADAIDSGDIEIDDEAQEIVDEDDSEIPAHTMNGSVPK